MKNASRLLSTAAVNHLSQAGEKSSLDILWPDKKLPFAREKLTPNILTLFNILNSGNNKVVSVQFIECAGMQKPEAKIIYLKNKDDRMLFILSSANTTHEFPLGMKIEIKMRRFPSYAEVGKVLTEYRRQIPDVTQPILRIVPVVSRASSNVVPPVKTPSKKYSGEYLEDVTMREFLSFLKKETPDKPSTLPTGVIYEFFKKFFVAGYEKGSFTSFIAKNFEAFAIKMIDRDVWQINWREITAFIHGDERPKICKPIVPKIETLSMIERIELQKARPALENELSLIRASETRLEAEIEAQQTRLTELRTKRIHLEIKLQCKPFSSEELAALADIFSQK